MKFIIVPNKLANKLPYAKSWACYIASIGSKSPKQIRSANIG